MNILCCGFFSALQRTLDFSELRVGQVNRARGVLRSVGGKAANSARVACVTSQKPYRGKPDVRFEEGT